MKFKYNGRIYNPSNVEKKLKKLGITINDVEIIEDSEKQQEFKWELEGIKEWRYYKHPDYDTIHCCLIDIGTNPSKEELFKRLLWNEDTRTGVRKITKEYIDKLEEYVK